MPRTLAVLLLLFAGCSTFQPAPYQSSSNPRYRFGDCVRFVSSNHHLEKTGQILEVKEAQYYLQVEVQGGANSIYSDLIPFGHLEQATVPAPCPSRQAVPAAPVSP